MFFGIWDRCWHLLVASIFSFALILIISSGLSQRSNIVHLEIGKRYPLEINIEQEYNYITWQEEVRYFAYRLQHAYGINEDKAVKYSEWILLTNLYTGAPEILLAGVIMTESSFRENAISSVGAIGPSQIMPRIWSDFCQLDLEDPYSNVHCSGKILVHYYEYCEKNWVCALKNYNLGPGNLKKKGSYYRNAGLRYTKKIDNHLSMLKQVNIELNEENDMYADLDISLFVE